LIKIQNHYKLHKKYPIEDDFPSIAQACKNQLWKDSGITIWEDLKHKKNFQRRS
jgi:hypothetical protein